MIPNTAEWLNSCHEAAAPALATPCHAVATTREEQDDRLDSFEIEERIDDAQRAQTAQQTSLACVMSQALAKRASSQITTSLPTPSTAAMSLPPASLPSGIAPRAKVHEFLGHDGTYLNDAEMNFQRRVALRTG